MNRRFLKTISYRILGSLTTIMIVYVCTGEIKIAGLVSGLELIIKLGTYYLHEFIWEKI